MNDDKIDHDDNEPLPDGMVPCPRCDGWRQVECHCGGDLCVCENYGEMDCPMCYGEGIVSEERYQKWAELRREMMAVMRAAWPQADQK